jgi:3-oxoacyl-[acyl-carrier protein] reductase
MKIRGTTAVVTGASGAVGWAITQAFSTLGVRTFALDLTQPPATDSSGLVQFEASDVADAGALQALITRINRSAEVDILVNNVGISPKVDADGQPLRFANTTLEGWQKVMDVNLTSQFICIQQLMPAMMARGHGRIINISSHVARSGGNTASAHYAASKAGVLGLTKAAAKEGATGGVNVNAVNPGRVASAMTRGTPAHVEKEILTRIPLGRIGQPSDIAGPVLFLASDMADYITGTAIEVNGGMYMGP